VTRILVGAETTVDATLAPSICTAVALSKPVPSISITVPATNSPPPGVMLVMGSEPPTVIVPAAAETE
jgi:hypothetical protein